MQKAYPEGNLNCGLAHGIPGPLALLALAHEAGIVVDGLSEAVESLATWIVSNRLDDEWGANWPTAIAIVRDPDGTRHPAAPASSPFGPSHAAWCYGSPGIARTLWQAGRALSRADFQALAIEAVEAIARRPAPARKIQSPTFCHGTAGLLQIVLRFAFDTGSESICNSARTLTDEVLGKYETSSLLGYRSVELRGARVDQPGLLDGAPGVALTLLAAAMPVAPEWDALFLLS
jgi:hypothetical protein